MTDEWKAMSEEARFKLAQNLARTAESARATANGLRKELRSLQAVQQASVTLREAHAVEQRQSTMHGVAELPLPFGWALGQLYLALDAYADLKLVAQAQAMKQPCSHCGDRESNKKRGVGTAVVCLDHQACETRRGRTDALVAKVKE